MKERLMIVFENASSASPPKSLSVTVPVSETFSFEVCHVYAIPLHFLIINLFLTTKRRFVDKGNNFY